MDYIKGTITDEEGELSSEELATHKKYTIPLKRYFEELYKQKPKPKCCKTDKHRNKTGEYYCTVCNKWYCKSCLKEHDEYAQGHQTILSTGFEVSSICENENCHDHGMIKYYCDLTFDCKCGKI